MRRRVRRIVMRRLHSRLPLLVMLAMFAGILLVALGGSYIAAKINGGTVSGGLFRTVDFAL